MSFASKTICARCSHQRVCSKMGAFSELKNTLSNNYDIDDDDLFEVAVNCKEYMEAQRNIRDNVGFRLSE